MLMVARVLQSVAFCLVACSTWLVGQLLSPVQQHDRYLNSNGVRIRYVVHGRGDPVILLHGFSASIERNWLYPLPNGRRSQVLRALRKDYQVIAIDCRGHGRSDKPHDPSQYGTEMVQDVLRLMDHLQLEKAHVVGYSMGALITLKLVSDHPDRVLSAVVGGHGGAHHDSEIIRGSQELADSLANGRGLEPLLLTLSPPERRKPNRLQLRLKSTLLLFGNDARALSAVARSFPELILADTKLAENQVPTLAVVGSEDPFKAAVERLTGKMSRLEVVVIEGTDHVSTITSPRLASSIQQFLRNGTVGEVPRP